jgi:hypothetical protein
MLVLLKIPDGALINTTLPTIQDASYQTTVVDADIVQTGPLYLSVINAQGETSTIAGAWGWQSTQFKLPYADADARFVPVGGDFAVTGVHVQTASPGEKAIVDVELVSLKPMTGDLATSVRLMDNGGRWLDRHDMQPAQGAVPTLKWIRGSRVIDRHLLSVPEDFTGDMVQAALVAYERFREITLPVLDGRFRDVPLGSWPQPR